METCESLIFMIQNTLKVDYKDFEKPASNEKGMKFLKSYDVIENYHNSGRTALIMHLDQKSLLKLLFKILIACVYHLSWPIWKERRWWDLHQ